MYGRMHMQRFRCPGRRSRGQATLHHGLLAVLLAGLVIGASAAVGAAGEMTFLRLTPTQYQRAIHEIFGPSIQVDLGTTVLGVRDRGLLALGARRSTLSAAEIERYEALAQRIAAQVTDPARRATLIGCRPKAGDGPDDACAARFVSRAGRFLFRRPLTGDETDLYVAVARTAAETLGDYYGGLRAALAGMLVAPEFLFRVEHSEADPADSGKLRLDAWSRASRLSFFLWDGAPDALLLDAAESGELLTQEGLDRQVERLLASPRVEQGLRAFFSDMLQFDRFATLTIDSSLFPRFTKNVEDDAREQTLRTVVDHLLHRDRDYRDLFFSRDTFLTPPLAAIYGVPLPRSQELGGAVPWVPYRFPEGDSHVGLLAQVSFLALHSHPGRSSPTLRGQAVQEIFLCRRVPPPPPDVDFSLLQDTYNPDFRTTRDRLREHRENPACASCHNLTDPIGLTLEVFDAAGGYRTTENGAPIDASGELNGRTYEGPPGLGQALRDEPRAASCFVERVFSYGAARMPTDDERDWLADVRAELADGGLKWRALMRRIARSPDFYTVVAGAS